MLADDVSGLFTPKNSLIAKRWSKWEFLKGKLATALNDGAGRVPNVRELPSPAGQFACPSIETIFNCPTCCKVAVSNHILLCRDTL